MDLRINLFVSNRLLQLVVIISVLLSLLGLSVLFAWITGIDFLITLQPELASMVFNTALGIFFSGLGLICLVYKKKALTTIFAGIVTSLGFLTIIEYIFNINLGIDQLFIHDYLEAKTSHPGRMAPNTALSMMFSGLNLLLANFLFKKSFWISINAILATLIAVFGLVSLYGYLNELENTYGWGSLSQMAVHTASCFICIGLAQFIWAWHQSTENFNSHKWLPIPIGIFFSCFVFMLWGAMITSEDRNINFSAKNEINDLVQNINSDFHKITLSLDRMAKRVENSSYGENISAEQNDINSYLEQYNELKLITRVNNQEDIHSSIESFRLKLNTSTLDDITSKLVSNETSIISIISVFSENGENYLLIFAPIHFELQVTGYIFSIFNIADFIEKIISKNTDENYAISLKENEHIIYQNNSPDIPAAYNYQKSSDVFIADSKWDLNLAPKKIFLHNSKGNLSNLVLISGLSCALAFSLICLLVQKLVQRNTLYKNLAITHEEARIEAEFRKIHYQTIFDSAVEGIITIDKNGLVQDFNPHAERLFGYTAEEIIGNSVNCLMPSPHHEKHDQYMKNYLTTNVPKIIGITRAVEGKRKDGTIFPIELSVSEMNINDTIMFAGIVNDITERVNNENQILKTNEELKLSNDALQQFSYRTSHDLKSPLTTIKGLAKFIKMDISSGNIEEALDNINKISKQATKLENLVMNILELAKAELQESQNIGEIDLKELIEEIIEKHEHIIQETSVKVTYNIDSSVKFVSEVIRVAQILENIIVNGIKYCDPNKTERFVRIKAYSTDNRYRVIVEDNGLGVLEKDKDKIFTIFTRLHPKAVDGSGMGLYIVKRHIDKLKGEINVLTLNEGTSFEIVFPNKESKL